MHNYLSSQIKVGMISEVENAGTFSASLVMQLDFIVICETVHHLSRQLTWVGLISITAYIFKFNLILLLYFTLPVLLQVEYINKQPNKVRTFSLYVYLFNGPTIKRIFKKFNCCQLGGHYRSKLNLG